MKIYDAAWRTSHLTCDVTCCVQCRVTSATISVMPTSCHNSVGSLRGTSTSQNWHKSLTLILVYSKYKQTCPTVVSFFCCCSVSFRTPPSWTPEHGPC